MGAIFSRIKVWVIDEDVVYSDLNAEFDNILTNLVPLQFDDYSTNVAQMQVVTDPGEVGTESLATTLAGEIARLRFMIEEITGESEWYESPVASLAGLANAVGTGLAANRIVSGRVRTGTQFPIFLVPNGAARTVKVDGTPVNFIYYVNGIEYNIDTDVTVTNLTLAPSSNNTCLIDDANASAQYWTKTTGENGTAIPVDTMGSEITALTGKLAAFKLVNGSAATEYFIAEVASSTSLIRANRGYFFDSTDTPVPRVVYSNNNTITLMKLTWIFAKTDETLTATYNPPQWSNDEPSSPSIGDYWFDTANNIWKRYDVSAFVSADATLVGVCIQDGTTTIGARSFEPFANFDAAGAVELVYSSAAVATSNWRNAYINVWGATIKNERALFSWDMTLDRDSGVSETSSTYYYFYVTEKGDRIISDIRPYDRREDLRGWYHPHQSWRAVGFAFNDGSSNLSAVESYWNRNDSQIIMPSQTARTNIEVVERIIPLDSTGGAFTKDLPPAAFWRGQTLTFIKTSNDLTAITLDAFGSETINGVTTVKMYTQYEMLRLLSDGTNIYIDSHYSGLPRTAYTPTLSAGFGITSNISFLYQRTGGTNLFVQGSFTVGTAVGSISTMTLPGTLAIDSTKLSLANTSAAAGPIVGSFSDNQAVANTGGKMVTATGTSTTLMYFGVASQSSANHLVPSVVTSTTVTGAVVALEFTIPITDWLA